MQVGIQMPAEIQGRVPRDWSALMLPAGILVRIAVFLFLAPLNNDDHGEVVKMLAEHGRMPTLWETLEAHHPPLYYLMAAPFWSVTGSYKGVQLLSLLCSIATLVVLYRMVYKTTLIANPRARTYCFLMACFLPQFVMFSLYLSNDTLAFLIGNLAILQAWRCVQRPDWRRWALLGLVTAVGLVTKLTFLVFLPVFAGLLFWVRGRSRRAAAEALVFFALTLAAGSYKLVDNYVRYGDPVITGLDPRFHFPFVGKHAKSYRGLASYVDANVFKLVAEPVLSKSTEGSYPVILYGTFWYQYIPESSFIGNRKRPSNYLGSVIYMVGLLPTAVFLIGWVSSLRQWKLEGERLMGCACALLLLFIGLSLLQALMKSHDWGLAQARYQFPAMFACLMVFAEGVRIAEANAVVRAALGVCMGALLVLFLTYFATECWRWV